MFSCATQIAMAVRVTESMVLCVCLLVLFTFVRIPAGKLACTVWKCNTSVTGFSVSN